MIKQVIPLNGGKNSTALTLLAIVQDTENAEFVFCDTGFESLTTYDYIDYLGEALQIPIRTVKADFSQELAKKRQKLVDGTMPGWSDEAKRRAIEVLQPTGIPYLDMCLWKGRFPTGKAWYCRDLLKRDPLFDQVLLPYAEQGHDVWLWQGTNRPDKPVPSFEHVGGGHWNYRPLLRWSIDDIFEAHKAMAIKPNPLYLQGVSTVRCMPCINSNKDELLNLSVRFPEAVQRVKEWEQLVSLANVNQTATLFKGGCITQMTEWAKTTHGGRQYDLIAATIDPNGCSSAYGLCDE